MSWSSDVLGILVRCLFLLGVGTAKGQVTEADPVTGYQLEATARPQTSAQVTQCRTWFGYHDVATYQRLACSFCYYFVSQDKGELTPNYNFHLARKNGSQVYEPDWRNETLQKEICKTLPQADQCEKWTACCEAAETCCESQLDPGTSYYRNGVDGVRVDEGCPSTWDGYACWARSPINKVTYKTCPAYIPFALTSEEAHKTCTENGTWYRLTNEWTNYTMCTNFDRFKEQVYVKLACDALSLLVLVPSLLIFCAYRQLRKQNRIRLHMNLFISFISYSLINIIWEVCVVLERFDSPTDSVMNSNSSGCKFLYVLTRYTSTTNYLWMFCEGLYLHRLIVKAFQPPKKLILFYLLGWGLPWIPVGAYSIIRLFVNNTSCWVHQTGGYEWIIYIPNFVALIANLAFLVDILRILLTQLQSHPNEPSNYRRALKATFVLVPLFGLQLFLIIYRPPLSSTAGHVYEIVSAVVVHTQGFFVALIFCLINGEVIGQIRRTCNRYGYCEARTRPMGGTYTGNTQTSDVYTRDSPTSVRAPSCSNSGSVHNKNYMPMKHVGNDNGCNDNDKGYVAMKPISKGDNGCYS